MTTFMLVRTNIKIVIIFIAFVLFILRIGLSNTDYSLGLSVDMDSHRTLVCSFNFSQSFQSVSLL